MWTGVEYFQCTPRRGLFVCLTELKPGRRMMKSVEGNYQCVHALNTIKCFNTISIMCVVANLYYTV